MRASHVSNATAREGLGDVRRTPLSIVRQVQDVGEVTCLRVCCPKTAPATDYIHASVASTTTTTTMTTYLVVGYSTGIVSVVSCSTFRVLWSTRVHDLDASVIELHIVGNTLLTQSRSGEVKRWHIDWAGLQFLEPCRLDLFNSSDSPNATVNLDDAYSFSRMCCMPRCQCVAYPSRGGRVTVHDYVTGKAVHLETTRYGMVTSLAGADTTSTAQNKHDKNRTMGTMFVCVGYESGRVEIYDVHVADGREHLVCDIPSTGTDPCVALACHLSSDGTVLSIARGYAGDGTNGMSGGIDELNTGPTSSDMSPPLLHIGAVALNHKDAVDSFQHQSPSRCDAVNVYRHTASVMEMPRGLTATLRGMDQIVFREDGKYVAAACWDGKVRIYRTSKGKLVDVIVPMQAHQASSCFAFHERRMAIGSRDGTVSLWRY